MKIIFLDIDGVMNTDVSMTEANKQGKSGSGADGWDLDAVQNLHRILDETGARIVISSTWRHERFRPELARAFSKHGLPEWIGMTPRKLSLRGRGDEIAMWMNLHDGELIERYVILDDNSDMFPEQMPFFVQTNFYEGGLTRECVDKAISILNGSEG